ncbi:hypothetical protein HGM15179_004069 [Zosterops borbonicus]|uniref:Uncharacterized protein n=1 Tax=Zosterops borbonicus TaxID=364589 RepID=A0A8K1LQI7_9PASS|nr:hypothetical protein HGM15179_004069 [Zosterops borbonicus]
MATAAGPGATLHFMAGAALSVGEAIPARSSPSLLLRLGAPGADNDSSLFHVDVNAWELLRAGSWKVNHYKSRSCCPQEELNIRAMLHRHRRFE